MSTSTSGARKPATSVFAAIQLPPTRLMVFAAFVARAASSADAAAASASGLNGIRRTDAGADGRFTARAGAKTCVLEVAPTPIASGAVDGEPVEPKPKSSR